MRKNATRVGSKTCNGLTYLKLTLLNIQRLFLVSEIRRVILGTTYQVGDHDLALTARRGGASRSGLGLLGLLCGLLDTANRRGGGSRATGIRSTAAAALAG